MQQICINGATIYCGRLEAGVTQPRLDAGPETAIVR
jgi:hypothetical protein